MPQPTATNLTNRFRDSINVDGVVIVVYRGHVLIYNGPIIWRHYLLNIEQLNEVETDLVERYDVPLTKQRVTPDVMNDIIKNSFEMVLISALNHRLNHCHRPSAFCCIMLIRSLTAHSLSMNSHNLVNCAHQFFKLLFITIMMK